MQPRQRRLSGHLEPAPDRRVGVRQRDREAGTRPLKCVSPAMELMLTGKLLRSTRRCARICSLSLANRAR